MCGSDFSKLHIYLGEPHIMLLFKNGNVIQNLAKAKTFSNFCSGSDARKQRDDTMVMARAAAGTFLNRPRLEPEVDPVNTLSTTRS